MKNIRTLFSAGATGLALLALTLSLPRAAHSIAAALVQVTNTVATPAITQPVASLSGQQVFLDCLVDPNPSIHGLCYRVGPGGIIPNFDFVVPDGQSLVITSINFIPGTGGRPTYSYTLQPTLAAAPGESTYPITWTMPADGATHLINIPNGLVWPGGSRINFTGLQSAEVNVFGYLTAN